MRFSFRSKNTWLIAMRSGFTLIEVMISVSLLALISLAIYQATTETFKLRDRLLHEGDFYNGIRMAMSVVDRDVSMLYSPLMMKPEQQKPRTPNAAEEPPVQLSSDETNEFWGAPADKTGIRPSRFIGTESKLSFISLSHVRIYKDAPESEFARITYELKRDEMAEQTDAQVLVKSESPNAFELNTRKDKMIHQYPLLRGIKKLSYRYYWKEKDRWENAWDSDREEHKNKYPDMVEVSVEVSGPNRLNFEGSYKFRPEVPLNGIGSTI